MREYEEDKQFEQEEEEDGRLLPGMEEFGRQTQPEDLFGSGNNSRNPASIRGPRSITHSFEEHDGDEEDKEFEWHDNPSEEESDNSDHAEPRVVDPREFVQVHIQRVEEDMKIFHDRQMKLMHEMDENYKHIERETQEYYLEFL